MGTFKGRGLVLKEFNIGESDKIITLLLKERGKINVSVRGGRKPGSKFLSGSQIFTYSDFVIFEGSSFFSMTQVDLIESFYNIRTDYERLCYGNYFLEMTEKTTMPGTPCDDLLFLLLRTLSALCKNLLSPKLIARIFELKFMQLSGYAPETRTCCVCGGEFYGRVYFNPEGAICQNCLPVSGLAVEINKQTAEAIFFILNTEISQLYKYTVNDNTVNCIKIATEILVNYYLDINLKSKELMDTLF